MAIGAIIAGIISAIGAIAGAIGDAGKAVLDVLISIFQSAFQLLSAFLQSAPTPMRIAIFLFFILTFGNVFSNFFLGTTYACDSVNQLYKSDDFVTSLSGVFKINFQGMSEGERNAFLQENYQIATPSASPTNVRCVNYKPRLLFYSINLLDYKLWMLLLVALFGIPMILSYYSKMGVLHN